MGIVIALELHPVWARLVEASTGRADGQRLQYTCGDSRPTCRSFNGARGWPVSCWAAGMPCVSRLVEASTGRADGELSVNQLASDSISRLVEASTGRADGLMPLTQMMLSVTPTCRSFNGARGWSSRQAMTSLSMNPTCRSFNGARGWKVPQRRDACYSSTDL